jgi:hypothetical protein
MALAPSVIIVGADVHPPPCRPSKRERSLTLGSNRAPQFCAK